MGCKAGAAAPAQACNFIPDIGVPFINRIRLSSGGNIIEDIEDWNKIYAFMLLNQSSGGYANNDGGASGYNLHRYITASNPNSLVQAAAGYMANTTNIGIPLSASYRLSTRPRKCVRLPMCLVRVSYRLSTRPRKCFRVCPAAPPSRLC